MRGFELALGIAVVTVVACGDGGPTPPTPTPSPVGTPNATAFANLALVQSLERASGRKTRLVAVSARVERSGRVKPGLVWHYTFQEPLTIAVVTQWRVSSEGVISSETYGSCGFEKSVEMAPLLGLDSDRIMALALEYGVGALFERLPAPKGLTINYIEGRVRVRATSPDCDPPHNGVEMDPTTGALLAADFSCFNEFLRPCVMPGVF